MATFSKENINLVFGSTIDSELPSNFYNDFYNDQVPRLSIGEPFFIRAPSSLTID